MRTVSITPKLKLHVLLSLGTVESLTLAKTEWKCIILHKIPQNPRHLWHLDAFCSRVSAPRWLKPSPLFPNRSKNPGYISANTEVYIRRLREDMLMCSGGLVYFGFQTDLTSLQSERENSSGKWTTKLKRSLKLSHYIGNLPLWQHDYNDTIKNAFSQQNKTFRNCIANYRTWPMTMKAVC